MTRSISGVPNTVGAGERGWRTEFAEATASFDWAGIDRLTANYVAHLYARPELDAGVAAILQELREHLRFEALEAVADAALAHSPQQFTVRRQYAQALVDSGRPALAVRLYAALAADPDVPEKVKIDARGGIGRCNKEMFLVCTNPARRADLLRRAFDAYYRVYAVDPAYSYHGINAVALAARAEREVIDLPPGTPGPQELARRILDTIDADPTPDPWSAVTAAEACIALDRDDDAVDWVGAFLTSSPSGFTIRSFLWQLTAVWGLTSLGAPGDRLLAVLRSALLTYTGGEVAVEPADVRAARLQQLTENSGLEKVLGTDRYRAYRWYVTGLTRCRAVARIQTRAGRPVGTGFLIAGRDLHPDLPDRVLVTNAHVVPDDLAVEDAVAVFHGLAADPGVGRSEIAVERLLWSAPSNDLDVTLLALRRYPDVAPIPLAAHFPTTSSESRDHAYVISHDHALDEPRFSLHDSLLLDHDERVLRYRSSNKGGSSGSPVMDDEWRLIGVHRLAALAAPRLNGRGGTYAADEAALVSAIRGRMSEHAPGRMPAST